MAKAKLDLLFVRDFCHGFGISKSYGEHKTKFWAEKALETESLRWSVDDHEIFLSTLSVEKHLPVPFLSCWVLSDEAARPKTWLSEWELLFPKVSIWMSKGLFVGCCRISIIQWQ